MRKIPHWLEAYSEGESLDILCDLGEAAALEAASPMGKHLAGLIRKGRLREVCEFVIPLDGSAPAHEVRYLRQAQAFFSKLEFLDLGIDKEAVAVEAFMDAEQRCRETNAIWQGWHEGWIQFSPEACAVFHLAQGHIQRILGARPTLEELHLRFGPGATSLTKKRESSVKRKLGVGVSCSDDLIGWARALLSEMPHLAEIHAEQSVMSEEGFWGIVPVVIHTGAVSFVDKNYKTKRTTETQPTLNGMLQLAIGDEMFRRARHVRGLDLRDQTLNQRLAYVGSLTGEVATLDLKSASNCIAVRLVQSLFPEDWFSMLKSARCGTTRVPGVGTIKLEMFSGMGNGFTFPLQSILFWALARSCATVLRIDSPIVSVYGDDIIVDTACVGLLKQVLTCAGLIVNEEKSFATGPFRESCGADFLSGIDVRPVYVKEILTPAVLFTLHNGLYRKGFRDLATRVRHLVHPELALEGPDDYGDGHLVGESWREAPSVRRKCRHLGFEGLSFDTFARSSKKDWTYHPGDRILHTYAAYSRGATPLLGEGVPGLDRRFVDPITHVTVSRPWGDLRFVRAWVTGHGSCEEVSPLPFGNKPESWGPVERELGWDPVDYPPDTGALERAVSEMIGGTSEASAQLADLGLSISEAPEGWVIRKAGDIPARKGWQGRAKACPFPGVDGYKKIAIYTLDR